MKDFLVLVSRHFFNESKTDQLEIYKVGNNETDVRNSVRLDYPMEYTHFWEDDLYIGFVAHFTGEIFHC